MELSGPAFLWIGICGMDDGFSRFQGRWGRFIDQIFAHNVCIYDLGFSRLLLGNGRALFPFIENRQESLCSDSSVAAFGNNRGLHPLGLVHV